ncbi:unnamed protein product, partial [Allacma fusca]
EIAIIENISEYPKRSSGK